MPVPHDRFDRIDLHKQLGWPPELPIIGFVGRLEEVKGPDRFIELALKSPAELGFVIIGGGSMEQTLRNRVEQSGHEERVRLIGQVRDAVPYLDSLDLVVLTSLHEGTPMIVLEAASREIPVIAFDVGGLGALLGSCGDGRLVPDGDIDAMRSTIDRLLSSPDETRAETRLWATALRDVFGMSAIIDAHVELYSSLFAE
jgi:glycosyltransferase involved in cell wall biosynthesis